ncbi:MAG: SpoIIE family protein phosphatase, partial [Flavobacteriales bacterium]|nr:SpoIIE family protein phosphatase [Flavobacteriales bacterium]
VGYEYMKGGGFRKAIPYLKKAKNIYQEKNYINGLETPVTHLYNCYKNLGDWKNALKMFELVKTINDSLIKMKVEKDLYKFELNKEYQLKKQTDSIYNVEERKIKQLKHDAELKEEKTIRYGILGVLALIFSFSFLLLKRFRITKKQNKIIKAQKLRVDETNENLALEKQKVERKNKEIITSINYAKKIQHAILPEDEIMSDYFSDNFILFQPKDIVGGDFYWYRSFGNIAAIACVDCTGHGVPGGFMSMMGSLLLDKIIQREDITTSDILEKLNDEIIRVLKQDSGGEIQDGMDLSLCVVDKAKRELLFSGARNGIYLIEGNNIKTYKADMLPAGGSFSKKSKEMNRKFTTQKISLKDNTWVIMYSDGYCDQLGGDKMMSMGNVKFEEILQKSILQKKNRKEFLIAEFNKWKGSFPQIDDLLIIGLKV